MLVTIKAGTTVHGKKYPSDTVESVPNDLAEEMIEQGAAARYPLSGPVEGARAGIIEALGGAFARPGDPDA